MVNYTLTMQNGANGTSNPASGANVYADGTVVTVTAIPQDINYGFNYWTLGGVVVNDKYNPYVITMNTNYTLKCWFAIRTHNSSRHSNRQKPAWRIRREARKASRVKR